IDIDKLLVVILSNCLQELEKSYSAQKMMLKQQEEMEAESVELQEFLQAEKAALADTLRDLENEVRTCSDIDLS
ncbi:hypothetical protein J6590_107869, partial [Homalodisca vitripennis]